MRILAIVHQRDAGPGVFAEEISNRGDELDLWLPAEQAEAPADPLAYDGVIALGGAMHPDREESHPWMQTELGLLGDLLAEQVPTLGVCLGAQLLARAAGAKPRRAARPEIGWHPVELTAEGRQDPVLSVLPAQIEAFQWHSYEFPLPGGAAALAESEVSLQACRVGTAAWAIQFHAEVSAADAIAWVDDYRSDEDAVRIGIDPVALGAETEAKIGGFNRLGRDLCGRWLDVAGRRRAAYST
jgi:GMP synthase (glutamine-hydrolysing)